MCTNVEFASRLIYVKIKYATLLNYFFTDRKLHIKVVIYGLQSPLRTAFNLYVNVDFNIGNRLLKLRLRKHIDRDFIVGKFPCQYLYVVIKVSKS